MRFSAAMRLAALAIIAVMCFTGCHSVFSEDIVETQVEVRSYKYEKFTESVSGTYPAGVRAFYFRDSDNIDEMGNFQLVGYNGNTFLYFYSYRKKDKPSSGYYALAYYNFVDKTYSELYSGTYSYGSVEISGVFADMGNQEYIGCIFRTFVCVSYDSGEYSVDKRARITDKQLSKLKDWMDVSDGTEITCVDIAMANRNKHKVAAVFAKVESSGGDSGGKVLCEITVESDDGGDYLEFKKEETANINKAGYGNYVASDNGSDNTDYWYIVEIKSTKITFGVWSERTLYQYGTRKYSVTKKATDTLRTFAVKDSQMYLVFDDRIEIWDISEKEQSFKINDWDWGIEFIFNYRCAIEINDPSNYRMIDVMPMMFWRGSRHYTTNMQDGLAVYDTYSGSGTLGGDKKSVRAKGSYYAAYQCGSKSLLIGFDQSTFSAVVKYYNSNGELQSQSSEEREFTLAQLPYANVYYCTNFI